MKLEEYLKKYNITQLKFSKALGISAAAVHYIARKKRNPSILIIKRIEEETNGEVTVTDLFNEELSIKTKKKIFKE